MTSMQVLATLRRRWYVAALGLVVTLIGLVLVHAQTGVCTARAEVLFLAPKSARFPNSIQTSSSGTVALAGLVKNTLNGTDEAPATASTGASLAGQGVRRGSTITLPDTGGQWAHNFSRPVLVVEAVGPTPSWVTAEMERQIRRIDDQVATRQRQAGARTIDWITTSVTPDPPNVTVLDGRPKYALAATAALGLWGTLLAAVGFDRAARSRRHRGPVAAPHELAGAPA